MDLRITARIAWKRLVILLVLSIAASTSYSYLGLNWMLSETPLIIFGLVILLLLSVRTFIAYERWNEAQRQWSVLTSESRSFVRQGFVFLSASLNHTEEQRILIYRSLAFLYSTKNHLRKMSSTDEIKQFLSVEELKKLNINRSIPLQILIMQSNHLALLRDNKKISDGQQLRLESSISKLSKAFTDCERIKNTIAPRQYSYYSSKGVAIYSFALPFALASQNPWGYVLLSTLLIGFFLFAVDAIAKGVENPFDNTINDVPMSALCRELEIEFRSLQGEETLPSPVEPMNGFLY